MRETGKSGGRRGWDWDVLYERKIKNNKIKFKLKT